MHPAAPAAIPEAVISTAIPPTAASPAAIPEAATPTAIPTATAPRKAFQSNPTPTLTPTPTPTPTLPTPTPTPRADSVLQPASRRRPALSTRIMTVVGESMLTVGVVLALFVVWQLYVTTWQVQGATAAAVESFTQSNATQATNSTQAQRFDPPPEVVIPPVGQTFATLHVPRWDAMVIPVMEGTTQAVLDTGYAGHYTYTQGPGQVGNMALAAHRRSYGNSFRRVEELQTHDPLVLETAQAWLVYQVVSTEVVKPWEGGVINPVPNQDKSVTPTRRLLTLTTCHPEYGNTERFIVYSELSYWVPRSQGRPTALQGLEAMRQAGVDMAPSTEIPPATQEG